MCAKEFQTMNRTNMDRFQPPTARDELHICAECGVEITGDVVWVHDVPYHWNCQPNNQDEDDE